METSARTVLGLALLVTVGSAFGTLLRSSISGWFPHGPGEWPWATFAINIVGSFVLGLLLETLARRGPDAGRRRMVRLGVGTGVLGGFTTYSTFVVEIGRLGQSGHLLVGASYALVSIVLGLAAAGLGVAVAGSVARAASDTADTGTIEPGRPGSGDLIAGSLAIKGTDTSGEAGLVKPDPTRVNAATVEHVLVDPEVQS